ncbi:uncharacterized protein NFIA_036100 [Aspergillus fischeri NRRL 181]|uniref:Uncharacterized protein n=1 Tax=Neosartorya fischeri (strain ATCC 1020 / DSM 3700 / CBS 544.65 / FGSC A1164 / JCM 1740 / NRRL 181 / WB 181) TaxID=331117 RepID=A1CZ68_NEOFI|nr:uncharacterized protein NFIA_036100 [Aspergillus fischeri NRRL 181]EAW24038.1 hypothetical protein NFIA_036100 [Aspergillus fischeri NRRL 181]KAG2017096.1 hypothetical protein GB937_005693 [Aspergillus fischeri]
MALPSSAVIKNKPIGTGLNSIRGQLVSVCVNEGLPCSVDSLQKLETEALQTLPASCVLQPVKSGSKNLFGDLSRLSTSVNSNEFDVEQLIPLLGAILKEEPDVVIWNKVYKAVTEPTPPPQSLSFLN